MAKKSGGISTAVTWGAALVGVYLLYRFFFAPKTAQAATLGNPVLTGGGTGAVQYPGMNAQGTQTSALQQIMNALKAALQGKSGSGFSMGSGGGPVQGANSAGAQGMAALQAQISAISTDSFLANNMPIAQLGGQSLADYSSGYDTLSTSGLAGYQLPTQNSNNTLDLTGWGTPIDMSTIAGGFDPSMPIDTTGLDTTGLSGLDTSMFGG
jgi:hypothetical protein